MMYTRLVALILTGVALAAPTDTFAQAGGRGGGVRARTKCVNCTRDSTHRARQEQLLLQIDSLRWQIEHVRMSPADRVRLDREMTRAVLALEASLDQSARTNEVIVARVAPTPEAPTAGAGPAFTYVMAGKPRGYLGVTFDGQPAAEKFVNGERFIRFLQYPKIALVDASSPAERAGIVAGDTLLSLDGHDVREEISLTKVLVPRSRVIVRVRREGDSKDLPVIVDEEPEYIARRAVPLQRAPSPSFGGAVAAGSRGRVAAPTPRAGAVVTAGTPRPSFATTWFGPGVAGAEVKTLSEGLGKAVGVREGVLVISSEPGTPAFESGLQDGDVILKADGRTIPNVSALRTVVARGDRSIGIRLVILRERKQRELTLRW